MSVLGSVFFGFPMNGHHLGFITEVFSTIRCVALRLEFWGAKYLGDEGIIDGNQKSSKLTS